MIGRPLVMWSVAAVSTSALLAGVLVWQHRYAQTRWSIFMVGDPHTGSLLFFEKEGCAHCHSVNGFGGKLAPDLGYAGTPQAGINQLVSAMWNHAPRMWERMRKEKLAYPDLGNEEMTHLFAFLYTARYVDEPGDQSKGESLYRKKGCVRCHSVRGGDGVGPDLAAVKGVDTPIRWTEAMWNHAPAMEKMAQQLGVAWPHFEGREMNDLLSYIRANSSALRRESELLPADPERGWKVFRTKSCIVCHAVKGKGGHVGPELGPNQQRALTVVQFSGLMWNHSPDMWKVPEARVISRPTFHGQEIADLVAFLSSLRYFEPLGSPHMGETIFAERGCDQCHGAYAEGARRGPALRGRGQPTTVITLATALWQHGPKMYQRTQQLGRPWPMLQEGDVGDIVAFLNSPLKEKN
jgi:cytochrome c2